MEFFDSHSHYNDEKFDEDRENIITSTYNERITKFICAGYDIESSKKALEISKSRDYVYTISGVSPNDIKETSYETVELIEELEEFVKREIEESNRLKIKSKIVAIGEIGLDYYWNKENKEIQKEAFVKQIELANKYNLPIVIHSRDAVMDTLNIIKNERKADKAGIFHCCQLNKELIKEALKLGFYISFAGPITFKNAKNAKECVCIVPGERILIETDSPYLAPEPVRGTRNDSRNVKLVAEKIADFKETTIEKIAKITYENAMRIFNI